MEPWEHMTGGPNNYEKRYLSWDLKEASQMKAQGKVIWGRGTNTWETEGKRDLSKNSEGWNIGIQRI